MRISDWSSDVCSSDLLADSVAERLRSTPGVSVVSVYGGRNREIDVAFDPVRLQAFSISLAEARGALAASDVGLNLSGPVEAGKLERLRYAGELGSAARSEEHTSELQSLMRISYAVFCLKKKKEDNDINKQKAIV